MTRGPEDPSSLRGRITALMSPEMVALVLIVVLAIAVIVILNLGSADPSDTSRSARSVDPSSLVRILTG